MKETIRMMRQRMNKRMQDTTSEKLAGMAGGGGQTSGIDNSIVFQKD